MLLDPSETTPRRPHRLRRAAVALGSIAALTTSGLLASTTASATAAPGVVPPGVHVSVTGVATVPAAGGDTTITFSIVTSGGPLTGAQLSITDPATLPAVAGTVRVDGAAAPSGTVDDSPTAPVVRLGVGASATGGGALTDGTNTVSYTADATAARTGDTVSAEFTFDSAPSTVSVGSGKVAVSLPDVVVTTPPQSGENQTLPLSAGQDGLFAVQVNDVGAPVSKSTLTITLPTGLRIDPDFGIVTGEDFDNLNGCTSPTRGTITCPLGKLTTDQQLIVIALQPTSSAPVGHTGTFTVSAAAASGVDTNPANNTVTGRVLFTPSSDLRVTLKPSATRVPLGSSATIKVTVHNAGPAVAPDAIGFLAVVDSLTSDSGKSTHFKVTKFTGKRLSGDEGGESGGSGPSSPVVVVGGDGSDGSSFGEQLMRSASSHLALPAASAVTAAARIPSYFPWDVARVAPGASKSATLTVQAVKLGSASVIAAVFAENDPPTDCASPTNCKQVATVKLQAVAAVKKTAPPAAPAGNGSEPVANTGVPTGQLTLTGLLAVLLGALMLWAGLGVRRGRHRA